MTPEQWRAQYGEPIERRRLQLGLSKRGAARAAGISEIVWRQIESGRRQVASGVEIAPNPEPLTMSKM